MTSKNSKKKKIPGLGGVTYHNKDDGESVVIQN